MSCLSMVEARLPPGFRFHPKDEELICDYLMKKVTCSQQQLLMIEVDLNKCEPWDIPKMASVGEKDWYFYSQRDRKYATGLRTNRATISGYWKATGKDKSITRRKGTLVGMRKTLVFYQGRAPKGRKTEWVMHEFRLEGPLAPPQVSAKEDWVLCRVFHKMNKELHAKQTTIINSSSSSSLPPLMESPYISFDQQNNLNNFNDHHHHQQVPCFSNIFNPLNQNNSTFLGNINGTIYSSISSSSACDLKSVLNHHFITNKMEINNFDVLKDQSPSFGEAGSSESFLSEEILPTMWPNQY